MVNGSLTFSRVKSIFFTYDFTHFLKIFKKNPTLMTSEINLTVCMSDSDTLANVYDWLDVTITSQHISLARRNEK